MNVLLGVGNKLRGDDGIGCYIAEHFKHSEWKCINTETMPENFTSILRDFKPELVVIIDSAEMKLKPGEFRIIAKEKMDIFQLTTHAMPLSVLMTYLEEFVPKVIFIGIQPKVLIMGKEISEELKDSAKKIIDILEKGIWDSIPQ